MGQNKSKEYEPGGDDIDGVANNVTQPTRNEVVRRESHAASDADRRKRRKWRKKQGYSLPVVGGSMSNLNPEDQDLPPAPVERGAVLVSYSRSDAERFAPLRPKIVNRRQDRQLSVDDVTSADLYDTPSSVRSCFALSPEKSRYLPSCDSLASIEPPLQQQQQRSLSSVSPPLQQQQQQMHFAPQLQQQMNFVPPLQQQPCDKNRSVPNVNSESFARRDLQPVKIVFDNKSGSKSSSHLDNDKKVEQAPLSYFDKVKKEIEKSDPIFEKVKQDIERERVEKDTFKVKRELPKIDAEKMKPNERKEEKAEIVFNFEKIPKKENNERTLSVNNKVEQKPIFVTSPTTSVPKSSIEKEEGNTPTSLVPPPLPPRPCTLQTSPSIKGDQNVSSQQSPTQRQQHLHSAEKDDDAANRNKNMTFSATTSEKQEEVGPLGAEVMTHNSTAINQNNNVCNVTIGSNSIRTGDDGVTFGGDNVDGNNVKIRSNGNSDVIDRRPMRIPVPARISNIVESGHAPNLFSNFEDSIELSVDDDDDDVTTEPLEMEQESISYQSPPFSRRVLRDEATSGIVTEPLAIVQEPVAYSSPRFSRRVKDCDDDSAILIDEDVESELVPAVRVEIYDEDDFDDDFPSFHNNSSVVRPFGSDVLSAITEEDKDDISSNLSSALTESLDQSFSRSDEKENELETEFEQLFQQNFQQPLSPQKKDNYYDPIYESNKRSSKSGFDKWSSRPKRHSPNALEQSAVKMSAIKSDHHPTKDISAAFQRRESSIKNVVEDSTKPVVNEFQTNSSQIKANGFERAFHLEIFASDV